MDSDLITVKDLPGEDRYQTRYYFNCPGTVGKFVTLQELSPSEHEFEETSANMWVLNKIIVFIDGKLKIFYLSVTW